MASSSRIAAASRKQARPDRQQRLEAARKFATEAAQHCADLRCRDVKVLDVTGISPVADFLVLATGASPRQMKSVADDVDELAARHDLSMANSVKRLEGHDRWIALDAIDVVVHIFSDEARLFYDLDNLWGDARLVKWSTVTRPPADPASNAAGDAGQD